MSQTWCRSCGTTESGGSGECAACGVVLGGAVHTSSQLGLAFAVPGRLRVTTRLGICVRIDGETAHLHLSAKEKETTAVPITALGEADECVPEALSPAARFIYAARQLDGHTKVKWDSAVLLARASEAAAMSVAAMRAVADEALVQGWDDIVEWTTLSDSEKAWRRAHHAATVGDLDTLATQARQLPADGYGDRVTLLLPHLPAVSAHAKCRALVREWAEAGIPAAAQLGRVLGGEWDEAMRAAIDMFPPAHDDLRGRWASALEGLTGGAPGSPLSPATCPAWRAASLVVRGRTGEPVGNDLTAAGGVAVSLVDDLIESGGVNSELDIGFITSAADGRYLLARLRPQELTDGDAREAGHNDELARRRFLAADRDGLRALPSSTGVNHYRALQAVVDGSAPDSSSLRTDVADVLEITARASTALADGATRSVPAPVARDRSLWSLLADHARSGRLSPDAELRAAHPDLGPWCDLHRLVGLLWEERWAEAAEFGKGLSGVLDDQPCQGEALSLTAYALLRQGNGAGALAFLERAISRSYTEALLVNMSVVAAEARPESAAAHFSRLIDELPTRHLRVAALNQALNVWNGTDESVDFPEELVRPLERALAEDCPVDEYAGFISLARAVAPQVVLRLPRPPDAREPIYRMHYAAARVHQDEEFSLPDLADEYVAIYRDVGRPDWFDDEWDSLTTSLADSLFVAFGEAAGSAVFIDSIADSAPELFTQRQRFVMLPQAGAHLAATLADDDDHLNGATLTRLFFLPIEEFLAERTRFDPEDVEFLGKNFHATVGFAGLCYMDVARAAVASEYNQLVDQTQRNPKSYHVILDRMRHLLQVAQEEQDIVDRIIDRMQRLADTSAEGRERLGTITTDLNEWKAETIRIRSNL